MPAVDGWAGTSDAAGSLPLSDDRAAASDGDGWPAGSCTMNSLPTPGVVDTLMVP